MSKQTVSKLTQTNWWIDAALFCCASIAILSGIYFLFLPSGGFQGGRNPMYNVQILFPRQTWDIIHTWGGTAVIIAALIHLVRHGWWVTSTARRTWKEITGQCGCINPRGRINLLLNVIAAISFMLTAISGVYFLFVPGGRWAADPMILFTRSAWDLLHTWAGVVFTAAVIFHFVMHWKWIVKTTYKMTGMNVPPRFVDQPATAENA
jgi:cytochrome b subunit of formate dehydrogenase